MTYTGTPEAAMAAAAWSWVEKMLQEDQVTSAPRAVKVSMRTAVWMAKKMYVRLICNVCKELQRCVLMCRQPAMRAPLSGWSSAYFSRVFMRPGISISEL